MASQSLVAQDRIIKLDRTEINCKVSEIGSSEIKYKKADNLDGPIYSVRIAEVYKIVFENGKEEIIKQNVMAVVANENLRHYKRAITIRPFSVLAGYLGFGYQVALSPTRAFVSEIGIIGIKSTSGGSTNDSGVCFRLGYRLKRTPEFLLPGMEWGYNLAGFYVQPEIAVSTFNSTPSASASTSTSYTSGAFLINLGKQFIVGDIITVDLGVGLGYGTRSISPSTSENRSYYYTHTVSSNGGLAATASFSMGILLK